MPSNMTESCTALCLMRAQVQYPGSITYAIPPRGELSNPLQEKIQQLVSLWHHKCLQHQLQNWHLALARMVSS